MAINWELEISKLVYVKQVISEVDSQQLWPHHFPGVAASSDDIAKLKRGIGRVIPKEYLEFLQYANGWKGFYQSVDLFGVEELLDQKIKRYTDDVLDNASVQKDEREDLLTIAATPRDIDLFCLNVSNGQVVWFAGAEVDRFDNFNEYYLSMLDHNREEISDLKSQNK